MDPGQVVQQMREVVQRGALGGVRRLRHLFVGERRRSLGQAAVAVVLAVDAQRAEVGGQALDLAQEVGRREPALAELAGQRVGGGRERHARLDQLAEQRGDEHGVAGVVQLELVDAQQTVAAERLHGLLEPERTDQVGQLHEGAERLERGLGRGGVPQGGEQMGLADAVAAVQVDAAGAGRGLGRLGPAEAEQAAPAGAGGVRAAEPGGEALQNLYGLDLAGLVRVRDVGGEADRVEARRRHHLGDQTVRRDVRLAGAQGLRARIGQGAGTGSGGGG